ncbi:hypothetical protein B0T24DRAFT_600108 [Lasiosphaeria ovina]|uniref:F-box domain-containing protein n=1 Tax=Lasiosphaeria ovina TaxID=92902 RepID=A0AAE0JSY2_9PEZI|nr:hypothetical protein B0T24DRAFT_600108 [Lasiosphaeria ovina]
MAVASAAVFARIPELVLCLLDVIRSPKQLATLCRVSKAFNAAATPHLFCELHCEFGGDRFASLAGSSRLGLVKRLTADVGQLNWVACNIMFEGMMLTHAALETLSKSCSRLKSPSIRYPPTIDSDILEREVDDEAPIFYMIAWSWRGSGWLYFLELTLLYLPNLTQLAVSIGDLGSRQPKPTEQALTAVAGILAGVSYAVRYINVD